MAIDKLCDETTDTACPPPFRTEALGWVDVANAGVLTRDEHRRLPSGVRLRWNLPADVRRWPARVRVFRASIEGLRRWERVDVGMRLRPSFDQWSDLARWAPTPGLGLRIGAVERDPCGCVQGVYVVLDSHSVPSDFELISVDGDTIAWGQLKPGEHFYFEASDIRCMRFSHAVTLSVMKGLTDPSLSEVGTWREVAVLEGMGWRSRSLSDLQGRLQKPGQDSFATISEQEWMEIVALCSAAVVGDDAAWEQVCLRAAQSWQIAVLLSLGYLDGSEHQIPPFDSAVDRLSGAPQGTSVAYHVICEYDSIDPKDPLLPQASLPALVTGRAYEPDRLRGSIQGEIVADIVEVYEQQSVAGETNPSVTYRASTSVDFELQDDWVSPIEILPTASRSNLAQRDFLPTSARLVPFDHGVQCRGLTLVRSVTTTCDMPFLDSQLRLDARIVDSWDRLGVPERLGPDPVVLRAYYGTSPRVRAARFPDKSSNLRLDLTDDQWSPDEVARLYHAETQVLIRKSRDALLRKDVNVGPPVPNGGLLRAVITLLGGLEPWEAEALIGGRLSIGSFEAKIRSLTATSNGFEAVFEPTSHCGQLDSYSTGTSGAMGVLEEDRHSTRPWEVLSVRPVPDERTELVGQVNKVDDAVEQFYVTTRQVVVIGPRTYVGPLRVPEKLVLHLGEQPPDPGACFEYRRLGIDYFGRPILRVRQPGCLSFDRAYQYAINILPGHSADQRKANETEEQAFRRLSCRGLFGNQDAFEQRTLFDVFPDPTRVPEGEVLSAAVSARRPTDDQESAMQVQEIRHEL